jgi:predicted acylesterase/phospholipase RssA
MRECDLIMKGGITSGVVYPFAIVELAKAYRLRSVGGASAGAIAAVLAAAAEHRRQASPGQDDMTGFDMIGELAHELATDLQALFQPVPALKGPFAVMMAALGAAPGRTVAAVARAAVAASPAPFLAGGAVALVALAAAFQEGGVWIAVFGALSAAAVTAALLALTLWRVVKVDLPANDFGICPGIATRAGTGPGLTDWIADKIDVAAGNVGADGALGAPLTIGDLAARGIEVAAMTTDLSSQRPYQLPLRTSIHYFSVAEFRRLFPARVVDHLIGAAPGRALPSAGGPDDLHQLPNGDAFPVVLCARMSLSFPGLISAVPLWRQDFGLKDAEGLAGPLRRCLFSDGGISSNFPIHFFDAMLPTRPTFGISLTSWDQARHGTERVCLSDSPVQSTALAVRPIAGPGAFVSAILNTAKDWQDTLQSKLPGYAERIVEVRLDDAREGGMNLAMDAATIETLAQYGRLAGKRLVEEFDFDEHRWRRALSLLPNLEGSLMAMARAHDARPAGDETGLRYAEVLTDRAPVRYKGNSEAWRRGVLGPFAERLAELGRAAAAAQALDASDNHRRTVQAGKLPRADASLRITADADRRPGD